MTIFSSTLPTPAIIGTSGPPSQEVEELSSVNFFSGFGDWTTPGDHALGVGAWSRSDTRVGLSQATGPAGGAFPVTLIATQSQFYGYCETSPASPSTFSLQSPTFDASAGTLSLVFPLFLRFGVNGIIQDGTLQVFGWNGSAWSQIGASIIGSKQQNQTDAYLPSTNFDDYDSEGFNNPDFHFGILFTRGADPDFFNYDAAVDNLQVFGPPGALVDAPPPPPSPGVNGIFAEISGADGVNAYESLGFNLNYPGPEQPHNRTNNTVNPLPFAGSRSLRTEVRKSDPKSFVDSAASGKKRAEKSGRPGAGLFADGVEGWLGFALYLPSNEMADIRGCSVAQLHTFTEEMLQVSLFGGKMQLVSDGPSKNKILFNNGDPTNTDGNVDMVGRNLLDRWFRFRVNFLPSTISSGPGAGFIKIWIDDDVEASPTIDYVGRTGPRGPYGKWGLYWWNAASDFTTSVAVALHDNIRFGNEDSDFASVDPFNFVRSD